MKTEYPLTGGVTRFRVEWPYLSRAHVIVLVDTTPHTHTWISDHEVEVTDAFGGPVLGTTLTIVRVTPDVEDFAHVSDATNLTAEQLNRMRLQLLYLIQERAGGMAGYIGDAVGAVSGDLQEITDNLGHIDDLLATLAGDLATLNALRADVTFAKNEAQSVRDDLLAQIEATAAQMLAIQSSLTGLSVGQAGFGAQLMNESSTRFNNDLALAASITALDAHVTSEVGAINASITEVDAASAGRDAAMAERVTSLEAVVDVEDGETISSLINEVNEARATADAAMASQITTLQSQIGAGGNLFPNPTFDAALNTGWQQTPTLLTRNASGVPVGAPSAKLMKFSIADQYNVAGPENAVHAPVELTAEVWLYGAAGRTVQFQVGFYREDGMGLGWVSVGAAVALNGSWQRLAGSVTGLADGTRLNVRFLQSAAGDLYVAAPSIQVRSGYLAQIETNASTAVSVAGTAASQYTIKTVARADGKQAIAGIGLASTVPGSGGVAQSEVIIMADRILLTPPGDTNGTPNPIMVAGTVNGVPTTVFPAARMGDDTVGARVIVDGGIETRHMKVTGGGGSALNEDPNVQDTTAWINQNFDGFSTGTYASVAVSDGVVGLQAMQLVGPVRLSSRTFPVVAGRTYKASVRARRLSGAGLLYLRMEFRNAAGTVLQFGLSPIVEVSPSTEGVVLTTGWSAIAGTASAPAGAVTGQIQVHGNWNTTGTTQLQDVRGEEQIDYSLIVQGGLLVDRIAAGQLKTSNYAESGGVPTAGAKLDHTGTALKVAAGNLQLGSYLFTDYWFRLLQAIDGAVAGGRVVWRGNNDATTRGGAPNIDCLTVFLGASTQPSALDSAFYKFHWVLQPTAATDNLDSMRHGEFEVYSQTGGTALFTDYASMNDRLYNNPTDSNAANAAHGQMTLSFKPGTTQSGVTYNSAYPNTFSGHIRARVFNAYGPSAWKWFHGSTVVANTVGTQMLADSSPPSGAPAAGGGGGGGGAGGACPAPWVKVALVNGREVDAGSLSNGARLAAVNDMSLEVVEAGGVVRDLRRTWAQRLRLKLTDGRVTEWSLKHRFYVVDRGWTTIENLRSGDVIAGPVESLVESVIAVGEAEVVSFRVEGAGTYFGGGLLCHNLKVIT